MMKYLFSKFIRIPSKLSVLLSVQYNKFLFWINDIKYGKDLRVNGWIYIKKRKNSTITIGNGFRYNSGGGLNPLSRNIKGIFFTQFENSRITIGNNVGISASCIWCNQNISIEDNVNIGADCLIMDTDAHNMDYRYRNGEIRGVKGEKIDGQTAKNAPIVIQHDAWIGTRCIVLKGVTIGACSVIGSGSVVTKDIPANCIAAGNPCKVIKYLDFK